MKKVYVFFIVLVTFVLSGCSFLGEVNKSLQYVEEATQHITTLTNFAEEAPRLIQEAATDEAVRADLENRLKTLREDIEQFNGIDAPAIARDIHDKIVQQNEAIKAEIDKVLENGQLVIDAIENSQLIQTINEITELLNQLEQLNI
ncbi:DUF6376 family protein [Bacillus salinus]|uniref:DUF6376 family protein n=1 Tax=Bacillus sp. HMF5848 TaxID=2495421 RepID=UPI0021AE035E|nr:DUF6376 family protein [Bacillus sp. HMF5848]